MKSELAIKLESDVAKLATDVLLQRIDESLAACKGSDGLQSFAASLLLPLLLAERERRGIVTVCD